MSLSDIKRYKAIKNNFNFQTPQSVPCSPQEFNALKDGETIPLAEDAAKEMLRMNIVRRVKHGSK